MAKTKRLRQKGTIRGIAVHPKLHEPDMFKVTEGSHGNYKTKIRLTGEAAAEAKAIVDAFHEEAFEAETNEGKFIAKGPHKGEPYLADATFPYKEACDDEGDVIPGAYEFSLKTAAGHDARPANGKLPATKAWDRELLVVDSQLNKFKGAVWGGSELEVAFVLEPWFSGGLGFGVRMELKGVKIIKLVGPGNASAEDLFGAPSEEEGGFVADTSAEDDEPAEVKAAEEDAGADDDDDIAF